MRVLLDACVDWRLSRELPPREVKTARHLAPKTISHSFGFRPGIDLDKLGQLADELEAEAFAAKNHDSARRKRPRSRAQR